jgi:hypothetical protein
MATILILKPTIKIKTILILSKGSDDSDKIKEFNKISNFYGDKNAKLVAEYQEKSQALGKQSDSLLKIYMPVFQKKWPIKAVRRF